MASPAANDVLRITVFQNPGANPTLNVFHYRVDVSGTGTDYAGIGQAFWDQIKGAWRPCVAADYGPWFDHILVENVTDEIGFGTYTIVGAERSGTRTVTTEWLGNMCAAGVRMNVGTRLTKPGQKRFGNLYEQDQANGLLTATIVGLLTTLGTACAADLLWGLLDADSATAVVYGPVIPATADDPGRPVAVVNPVVSATVAALLTTQRTRRR